MQVSVFCPNCTTAALVLQFKEDSATFVTTSNTTINQYHCSRNGVMLKGCMFNYCAYIYTIIIGTTTGFNLSVFILPVEMFSMLAVKV